MGGVKPKWMRWLGAAIWLAPGAGAWAGPGSGTGTLKATVADAKGKAVAGAVVAAVPMGAAGGRTVKAVGDQAGRVSFTGLPRGIYRLCVDVPGSSYLDPCVWGGRKEIGVGEGQAADAKTIPLAEGSVLRVKVRDPQKKNPRADTSVGVLTQGAVPHPLRLVAASEVERTYELAIPVETNLRLAIRPGQALLADEKGAALVGETVVIGVRHRASGGNADVVLTVTGRK